MQHSLRVGVGARQGDRLIACLRRTQGNWRCPSMPTMPSPRWCGNCAGVAKFGTAHVKRAHGDRIGTRPRGRKAHLLVQGIQPARHSSPTPPDAAGERLIRQRATRTGLYRYLIREHRAWPGADTFREHVRQHYGDDLHPFEARRDPDVPEPVRAGDAAALTRRAAPPCPTPTGPVGKGATTAHGDGLRPGRPARRPSRDAGVRGLGVPAACGGPVGG